ncbi:hypothetical protein ACFLQ5_03345 [Bacteroidota bacterium]
MNHKKIISLSMMLILAINFSFAQAVKEIEKAQKAGKSIYLIVTDKAAKGTDALINLAEDASRSVKNTAIVRLDRDDKANAALISKYRLAGASLPIVLIVASNGVATGGFNANDATSENLISFLPTKTQAEVLLAFETGKAAFIVCGKKNAKDKSELEAECKKAITKIGNKAILVFIDVNNKKEENFLALLKPDLTKTTVFVFNGKGQYTGTLQSTAKSKDLIASVNKKVGGCCPGKSDKSGCGK